MATVPAGALPYGDMPPEQEQQPDTATPPETAAPPQQEQQAPAKPPIDYEKSYIELNKKFGEHSNLVGDLRKQVETLTQAQQQAAAQVETARNTPPPTDYEKELANVSKQVESGELTFEQGLLKSNQLTYERVTADFAAKEAALVDQTRKEVGSILQAKDSEKIVNSFHEANPTFQSLRDDGTLGQLKAQDPLLDDLSAYYKHQAMTATQSAAAEFERGKAEALRVAAGSTPASKVLSDPGSSMQQLPKTGRPTGEAGIKASMLAAVNAQGA